jgi:hypothetical protein
MDRLLGTVVRPLLGHDQAVPLEALKGRVHLSDVERPDVAGPGLELLTELMPVLGTPAEQA